MSHNYVEKLSTINIFYNEILAGVQCSGPDVWSVQAKYQSSRTYWAAAQQANGLFGRKFETIQWRQFPVDVLILQICGLLNTGQKIFANTEILFLIALKIYTCKTIFLT